MKRNKTKIEIQVELEQAQKRVQDLERTLEDTRYSSRFASVFRASPSPMALTDQTTGKYVEVNEAFLNLLGFSREEVIGRTATELKFFIDPEQRQHLLQRMASQGYLRNEKVLVRTKLGEVRHGVFSAEFIHENEQRVILTIMDDVTEKLEAEQRWQFALEGAGDGVWDWNAQTNRVFFSPRWKSMLGFEENEIGDSLDEWSSRVHPDDLAGTMEKVKAHMEGRTPAYESEHRVRCRDGGYKWILDQGKVISWTADNKPVRVIGTHKDITERKWVEEKLRESEERFSRVFQSNPVAQLIVSAGDGKILDANEAYCRQTGFSTEELIGHTTLELNLWSDPSLQMKIAGHLKAGEQVGRIEAEFYTRTGEKRNLLVSMEPVEIKGVMCIISSAMDITERKNLETALRQNEERYRIISDTVTDYAFSTRVEENGEYVMDWVSGAFETITGYTFDEFKACGGWRARLHPDDRRADDEARKELLANRRAVSELRIFNKDGREVYLRVFAQPLWDQKENRLKTIYGAVQDITERKRLELELKAEAVRRRILFEEAPDGILVIDAGTAKFLEFNAKAYMQLGYTREEFSKLSIFDVEAQENSDETLRHIGNVVRLGKSDFETVQRTKQGELRNVHVTAQVVDILGEPVYYCIWRDITERRRAEEARRESDDRYLLLFRNMVQGVIFQDKDGNIIHANPAAERILGLSTDQLIGRASIDPRWHAIHEDGSDFPGEDHPAMVALRTGEHVHDVIMGIFNPKNDSYCWININAVPRFMEGEKRPYQVFTTFEDITSSKRAELELRNSEKRLRSMLETSQAMSESLEMDVVLQKVVENATGLLQLESGAIYTLVDDDLFLEATTPPLPPGFPDELRCANVADHPHIQAAISKGSAVVVEDASAVKLTNAEKSVVESRGLRSIVYVPLMILDKAVGVLIVASVDRLLTFSAEEITLFKGFSGQAAQTIENIRLFRSEHEYAAELELQIAERKQAEEQLRESEQKYRDLINGMDDMVWATDVDLRILDANSAATTSLGYTREELLSMRVSDIDIAMSAVEMQNVLDVMPQEKFQVFETRHRAKDGREIPVEVKVGFISYMGKTATLGIARDITERKKAEQEILLAEQRYRALIEYAPDGVVLIDIDGKFKYASPSVERIFGYAQEDLPNCNSVEMTYPEDLPVVLAELTKLLEQPSYIPTLQYRFRHKDGNWRWIESTFSNLIATPGLESIIINFRDIHERKLSEEKLRASETRFATIFHSNPNPIALVSLSDSRLMDVNHSWENLTGWTKEEAVGKTSAELGLWVDPSDRERLVELLKIQGAVGGFEIKVRTRTGSILDQLMSAELITLEGARCMLSITQDITDRKRAEDELRLTERRYRAMIENAPDGIALINADGKFKYLSPAGEKLTGYGLEEMQQKDPAGMTHPDELQMVVGELEKVIQDPSYKSTIQYRFVNKSGEWRWVESTFSNLLGLPGLEAIILNFRDITERKQAEHILSESRTRLEMALEGAKAGMWDWNVQTGETVFNERWAEIVGHSLQELAPININTWVDLCHPDDLKKSDELLQKHFSGETEYYSCEARMRHKNGSWVWVLDQGRVMEWDENGKPVRMFGTHLDISAQKREERYTQAVLKLTNLSYEATDMADLMRVMLDEAEVLTGSEIGFFHFIDDDQTSINLQAWSTNTLTNLCTAEGQGQHYPADQAGVWADAIRTGKACIYNDYQSLAERKGLPDGHAPVRRLISIPIKRNNLIVAALGLGNKPQEYTEQDLDILTRLAEAVFDIIMRKRVEEALLRNEYRLRTVADFTYDMEFWMDEKQNLLYVSPSCQRITGYEREQFLKDPALLQRIVHPEDRTAFDTHEHDEFNLPGTCTFDFRIITAGGSVCWINHTCQAVTGDDGSFRGRRVSHRDVTEQKRILGELRASEEKYRGLLESLDSVVANVDTSGRFLYMNDTAASQMGGSPSQFVGKTMFELFPARVAKNQMDDIQLAVAADQGRVFENLSHVNGQPRWYRTSIQPLHGEDGKVVSVLVNSTDIHELKTVQQELQQLNRNLEERVRERTAEVRDLYENAPTGYHSLDKEGRYVIVNQTELNWLGYTREELIDRPTDAFMTEKSGRAFRESFTLFQNSGWMKDLEFDYARKDGSLIPVLLSATAVHDETGAFKMGRFTIFDNTERKQAENELKRNVNFTRALLNAVPTPVFYKDREGRYLGCNHAFVELMGKTSGEIQGKLPHEIWETTHADVYRQKDFELMEDNQRQVYESVVSDKDGTLRPVIFVKDIFFDESGNVAGLVGAFIDITERKKAEETLQHANKELARALRTKDEFLANISHELRTPLNGILGFTEMLLSGDFGDLDDRQTKYLSSIESSGRHLLGLINDLLDLAKIEAGKLEIIPEKLVIADLCQASLIFVKQVALKKGIRIELENEDAGVFMVADQRRLKQILVNLLSNAVKFTSAAGSVKLKASRDLERMCIVFSVKDTGIGISPEDMPKLFKPFTQVDSSLTRSHEGTGLGLALVRELVELHGGSIAVESEVGVGSTFTVNIPQANFVDAAPGVGEDPGTRSEMEGNTQPPAGRILLAEDMESNIMILGDYLEAQGFEVVFARNGREAVSICKEALPDLILMDIQMPEMDGLEAIRQIRADSRFATLPIVALTALAMNGDRERCLEAGATEYVSKPMNLKKLRELIGSLLGGQQ